MAVDRLRNNTIVILDTNAIFMPFQFKLNLDSELSRLLGEYEIIIPTCILTELRALRDTEKFGKPALDLALSKPQPKWYSDLEAHLLEHPTIAHVRGAEEKTDNILLHIAQELNAIVVTNDKILLKRLKENKLQTISMRGKKYLKLNSEV